MSTLVEPHPQGDAGFRETADAVRRALNGALRGKHEVVELVLACLLARGHILLEDRPGLGKTTLAKALAQAVGGKFARIQCTPDLLPGDITGFNVFNQKTREFEFVAGPVFADILLVDEINRTSPRTQSALLEVMAEGQVTVDNVRRPLDRHFLVIATQNPLDLHGTYPLPEAQLDRFAVKLRVGYPDREHELELLESAIGPAGRQPAGQAISPGQLAAMQDAVAAVAVERPVREYLVRLAEATRVHPHVTLGVSPRGLLIWQRMAQAWAWLEGRDFVTPSDVQRVAVPVLEVRLAIAVEAASTSIADILASTDVPDYTAPVEAKPAVAGWLSRPRGAAHALALLAIAGVLLGGSACSQAPRAAQTAGAPPADDEDDHDHHTPPHKPRNFQHAIERLRTLHTAICSGPSAEPPAEAVAELAELRDDMRWLPEIAARSDMPEAEWNVVNETSRELTALIAGTRGALGYQAASPQIEQLIEKLAKLPEATAATPQNSAISQTPH